MADAAPPNVPNDAAAVPLDGAAAITHLLTICGLSENQREAVMNVEGVTTVADLHNIYLGDVKQMTENLSRLSVNRGGGVHRSKPNGDDKGSHLVDPRCQCTRIHR
jgi:hypothetical protein